MSDIKIDLKNSQDASVFQTGNLVHQEEFNEALRLIKEDLEVAKRYTANQPTGIKRSFINVDQKNNTITVLGTRGSGKTAFLKSLLSYCAESENSLSEIEPLEIIDPTMIEEKGHIFLTVISIIKNIVDQSLEKLSDLDKKKKWQETVHLLAHGLPSMDGVGGGLTEIDWQDPEYIMEKGLMAVDSAFNLSKHFNNFIAEALEHIGKRAFLLTLDDIDVDFRKGWPVLETIRKYFTGAQIIIILSGDLRFYSLAIRKQKWKNFGKALLINEGELHNRRNYYNDLVTEMENQYLLKVLKPERRIHLSTLYLKVEISIVKGRKEKSQKNIYFVKTNKGKEIEILAAYKEMLSSYGINNNYQAEAYYIFLLGLPIRTQIHLLSAYYDKSLNSELDVFDPFLSDLFEKEIDVNLVINSPNLVNIAILKLLLKEKELADSYQLIPSSIDGSLNASLFSLNAFLSLKIANNPYLIFDYFIKIGYVRNLLNDIPYQDNKSENGASIEGFCKHSGVSQDKILRDIVGNMHAYLYGYTQINEPKMGMIPLPGLGQSSKKSSDAIKNRIDRVFFSAHVTKGHEILGLIPLSISGSSRTNRSTPTYSIYSLLGAIGEIIRKSDTGDLHRGLSELAQIRTYIIPESKTSSKQDAEVSEYGINDNEKKTADFDSLVKTIQKWIDGYPKNKTISVHVLGKISTRFFFALSAIENTEEYENLARMMHRRVVALLNSILIEDAREYLEDFSQFNNNNPNLVDKIFISNLTAAIANNFPDKLVFSRWLISCPLLTCFIDPSGQLFDILKRYIGPNDIKSHSIYHLLENVEVSASNKGVNKSEHKNIKRFNEVAEILKANGVPFSLFESNFDYNETVANNIEAKKYIKRFLNQDWRSSKLRRFRESLAERKMKW